MAEVIHIPNHCHFNANRQGRDFFVGDLHGQLSWFEGLLRCVGFDFNTDRVFSVGDLIDRGELSFQSLMLARESWFFPVLGNHETFLYGADDSDAMNKVNWYWNGGSWWEEISVEDRLLAKQTILDAYSLTLSVDTPHGLFGVLHGEPPRPTWPIHEQSISESERQTILWGRDIIFRHDIRQTKGARLLISGHTPVDNVTLLGNQLFIDTGSGHAPHARLPLPRLTLCELTDEGLLCYGMSRSGIDETVITL